MSRAERLALVCVALLRGLHGLDTAHVPGLADLYILDSRVYDAMAESFVSEGFFAGDEPFGHAPLYPLFLAALRGLGLASPLWPLGIQLALGVLNAAWVGRITSRLFGSTSAAAAILLFGLYAPAAMLETKLMATTLGMTLVLGCLVVLVEGSAGSRWGRWWFAGALLGAGCLVRPNTLLFLPLAAGYVLFVVGGWRSRGAWLSSLAFALAALAVIAPVSVRNHVVSGERVLITAHGGLTLFQSNNPRARGIYSNIPGAIGNPRSLARQLQARLAEERGAPVSPGEVDRLYRDRALAFLVADPARTAGLLARKLRFWLGNDEISTEYSLANERILTPTLWLMPVPFAVILGLAGFGLVECVRQRRGSAQRVLLLGFVLSNLATVLIFYFSSRYRMPAVAVTSVCAGFGLAQLLASIRERRLAIGASATAILLVAASLVPSGRDADRSAALQWYNVGLVFAEKGEDERAAESLERAAGALEDSWRVHLALAQIYAKLGRNAEAAERFRRVIELRPGSRDARKNLEEVERRLREAPRAS